MNQDKITTRSRALLLGVLTFFAVSSVNVQDGVAVPVTITLPVEIEIGPGGLGNRVYLSTAAVVPVAILSSAAFDATTVNPESVSLIASTVMLVGSSGESQCQEADVNGDGLVDLVCDLQTAPSIIEPGVALAILEGQTFDGINVRGEDFVHIVTDE